MPTYKDEKTGTWYCKFYYTDYTGTRKQKLKRGLQAPKDRQRMGAGLPYTAARLPGYDL